MAQFNIAVLVGSLRRDSFNAQLAHAIAKLAPAHFSFKEIAIGTCHLTIRTAMHSGQSHEFPFLRA